MFKYTVRNFVPVYSWETIPIETVNLSPAGDGALPIPPPSFLQRPLIRFLSLWISVYFSGVM